MHKVDFSGANLTSATTGADFTFSNLSGADLTGAYLVGHYFLGAKMEGTKLAGANLNNASLLDVSLPTLVARCLSTRDYGGQTSPTLSSKRPTWQEVNWMRPTSRERT